jgi:hypothetical protein
LADGGASDFTGLRIQLCLDCSHHLLLGHRATQSTKIALYLAQITDFVGKLHGGWRCSLGNVIITDCDNDIAICNIVKMERKANPFSSQPAVQRHVLYQKAYLK